ncbi:MAG: hypothetical protein HY908_02955 [Myxococcales bacterium]|nr:hypothetical protein [Myxococcales bacterium]
MKLSVTQTVLLVVGTVAYLALVYFVDMALRERARAVFRWAAAGLTGLLFFVAMEAVVPDQERAVAISKAGIAILAAAAVFYEQHRRGIGRPVSERWKRFAAFALALAAVVAYFNSFKFGYPKYYHRWDQYHYYMGAKYFKELGYTDLYRCAVVAQDEMGEVLVQNDGAPTARREDWQKEMRHPDKKVRKLGTPLPSDQARHAVDEVLGDLGLVVTDEAARQKLEELALGKGVPLAEDHRAELEALAREVGEPSAGGPAPKDALVDANLLIPVKEVLATRDYCTDRFSPERWEEYKQDVKFFRIVSGPGPGWWAQMQQDHGYNPPPVWTIAGKILGELHFASVRYLQLLATLDLLYLAGMFAALYWGFGWRVMAVAAIFWGTQSSAPFLWTGGALLRQDWIFFLVFSVACIRKRCFKLAGAAVVYAGLLRVFPGLVVIGTLLPFVAHIVRKRRIHPDHGRMLLGGVIAAALLIPASLWASGQSSYKDFYEHTLKVHDQTPLTNHMGLRVLVSHNPTPCSVDTKKDPPDPPDKCQATGRMQFTRDNRLTDPFEVWKRMRNERYDKWKLVAYAITGLTLLGFGLVTWRIKSLWVAQCLGQVFIILLSQLTCYYYSFLILSAPLIKLRASIELLLYGLAAVTQIIWLNTEYNDSRYYALTAVSLVACWVMIGLFFRKEWFLRLLGRADDKTPAKPATKSPAAAR